MSETERNVIGSPGIDSRAVLSPRARLAQGVTVGAYAIVGDDVELGEGCLVYPHAVLRGPARLGRDNVLHPFCSIGGDPQDLKYSGEPTTLEIGDHNVFRECVTLSRGTVQGGGFTRVGSDNLFMAYAHIAHDCTIGNHTLFVNSATLAGPRDRRRFRLGRRIFSRASVLPCRTLRLHWRLHGGHAGRPAILAGGERAREPLLRHQCRRPRAPGLRRRAHRSAQARLSLLLSRAKLNTTQAVEQMRATLNGSEDVAELIAFIVSAERGLIK